MLYNTDIIKPSEVEKMNEVLGKSYSFIEKIKKGRIKSYGLNIEEVNLNLKFGQFEPWSLHLAVIELRPNGIIVHFGHKENRYIWGIPYYRLTIFSTETFSLHADGKYIRLKKNQNYKDNMRFVAKISDLKSAYLNKNSFDILG